MILIEQYHTIIQRPAFPASIVEHCGRTCYKSEDKITDQSAFKFVEMLIKRGHESVIEHVSASVKFVTNRGVTHELVRHRIMSPSQESTRYVNYNGTEMQFIRPVWVSDHMLGEWNDRKTPSPSSMAGADLDFVLHCAECERVYKSMISNDWRPEQAREVLPNALKTEIVVTANFREWRHIFKLRTSPAAHPQMRALMKPCLDEFVTLWPVFFAGIQ